MLNKNKLFYGFGLLFALALGICAAKWWYGGDDLQRIEESQVLLEHVKSVSKLITTEGYFSEIYSEQDSKDYYLFSSTKKILIKVKAKVSAGYDLEKMRIDANSKTKTLTISNITEPSILSIEPQISYYDIANGVMNQFTAEDYTRLNKKAVDTIRSQALKSDFLDNVKVQGVKNFEALTALAQGMGWQVVFDNAQGIKLKN